MLRATGVRGTIRDAIALLPKSSQNCTILVSYHLFFDNKSLGRGLRYSRSISIDCNCPLGLVEASAEETRVNLETLIPTGPPTITNSRGTSAATPHLLSISPHGDHRGSRKFPTGQFPHSVAHFPGIVKIGGRPLGCLLGGRLPWPRSCRRRASDIWLPASERPLNHVRRLITRPLESKTDWIVGRSSSSQHSCCPFNRPTPFCETHWRQQFPNFPAFKNPSPAHTSWLPPRNQLGCRHWKKMATSSFQSSSPLKTVQTFASKPCSGWRSFPMVSREPTDRLGLQRICHTA